MTGYETLDIEDLRKQNENNIRQPFPHQQEAFAALSKTLPAPIKDYRGTLLVLPTGGGKTFTSINWICRNILSQKIKILWLAQSAYLIDQAAITFRAEMHNAHGRNTINMRIVSSSNKHANAGTIEITDDVLICTTQTAISAYSAAPLDKQGDIAKTPFRKFIESCIDEQLFVVIDEAHHTPAYGCRTLIISLRETVKNLYILGLTATPMHSDKRISGYLKNIYDRWICYKADKTLLQMNKVLSVPEFIERATGIEFEVNDSLYERLVNNHLDLPEAIIDNLANNQGRNNLIVSDYVANKKEYGKTLIFADRWFQCEYIVEKLKDQGIKTAAVYSKISKGDTTHTTTGRKRDEENRQAMNDFRVGKIDVLVNVAMLTEGVDVPDVKTVMITRQTTSNILLTQMIGRALRGEKAGGGKGKTSANIVFFYDKWKKALPWADAVGGMATEKPITQKRNPYELVSIQLVKLASADIDYQQFDNVPFITFIPTGFFRCEYTIAISENGLEEMITFSEDVIVYEFNKEKYQKLIDSLLNKKTTAELSNFAAENIDDSEDSPLFEKASELATLFFNKDNDGFDGLLINNISKIIRHVAQNGIEPLYIDFHERESYDLDQFAEQWLSASRLDVDTNLSNQFNDQGKYWHVFYKDFNTFTDAYYKSEKRALDKRRGSALQSSKILVSDSNETEELLTDKLRKEVLARDSYACLCCGKKQRKGVVMEIDHIQPVYMGGKNVLSNLQSLCHQCNGLKGVNDIDYRVNTCPMHKPKAILDLYDFSGSDEPENAIARIVNQFYHCSALRELKYNKRSSGKNYAVWEIILFSGNQIAWLEKYTENILEYIHNKLGYIQVEKLIVTNG
ncbi:hypothetical protein FACS1894140_1700 [Spirochaetia bacterium]|nr:hypothetical protein FACS1894140_1700 [Spirochaetia bacterium]